MATPLPLGLARQATEITAKPPQIRHCNSGGSRGRIEAVLDKDLAAAMNSGELAPATGAGVSIAVVDHGVTRVFSYGVAKSDSIFEIGSVSKTFTGLDPLADG